MDSREDFKSFIPASKSIPELTIKALLVEHYLLLFWEQQMLIWVFMLV